MSLEGVLADFPVSDVFQLIAQQRKTGVLTIENGGRRLEVCFLAGDVLRAPPAETRPDGALASFLLRTGVVSESALKEARRAQEESLEPLASVLLEGGVVPPAVLADVARLTTHETIFELFLWDDGRFGFRPEEIEAGPYDQAINAEMFLLDALRMRDEWINVASHLPDLSVTVSRTVDPDEFRARRAAVASSAGITAEEIDKLFNLVDGRLSARRVIDLSRLGTFKSSRGLVELLRAGALRVEERVDGEASTPSHSHQGRGWRWVALGASGAVALLLNLWPQASIPDYPLPAPDLSETSARVDTDRLKAALETHRWLEGEYPSRLRDLEATIPALVAVVPLDRYIYARSTDGYALNRSAP
jgi:hypothetical protein